MTDEDRELSRRLWFAGLCQKDLERLVGKDISTIQAHARREGWPSLVAVRREIGDRIRAQLQSEIARERMERAREARRTGIMMRPEVGN